MGIRCLPNRWACAGLFGYTAQVEQIPKDQLRELKVRTNCLIKKGVDPEILFSKVEVSCMVYLAGFVDRLIDGLIA